MTFPQQQWFFYLRDSLILVTESDTNLGIELALNSSWEHLNIYMYEKTQYKPRIWLKIDFQKGAKIILCCAN